MALGKNVRLYLADGTPGGLLLVEVMNWTGHVIAGPRSDFAALTARDGVKRTGVYILLGDDPDPEVSNRRALYVGEGDDVSERLKKHMQPEDKGGKDFWDRAIVFTSKDSNLTKAHARFLESRLIAMARQSKRASVLNSTTPDMRLLPEADQSDMATYLDYLEIVLPILGVTELRPPRASAVVVGAGDSVADARISPIFTFELNRLGIVAQAQEVDGEFTVIEGSSARSSWIGSHPGYQQLHDALIADGTIVVTDGDIAVFSRDAVFSSPSAAAAVVSGRSANGRTSWVDPITNQTFGQWQSRGVEDQEGAEGTSE